MTSGLKRVGLFCFPIKHSTHTPTSRTNYEKGNTIRCGHGNPSHYKRGAHPLRTVVKSCFFLFPRGRKPPISTRVERPESTGSKIMFFLSRLFFFGITNMLGVDSCVFYLLEFA